MKNIFFDLSNGDSSIENRIGALKDFVDLVSKDFSIRVYLLEEEFKKFFNSYSVPENLKFVLCKSKIDSNEKLTKSIKNTSSTIHRIFEDYLNDESNVRKGAIISSCPTNLLVYLSYKKLGAISENVKPVLGVFFESITRRKKLALDLGSNISTTPKDILNYSKLGTIYYNSILNKKSPRVGLLNIGVEETKGIDLMRDSYKMLKENGSINFVGNIEANKIFEDDYDILVTDAFSGNLVLKTVEGTFFSIKNFLDKNSFKSKIGMLFLKGFFKKVKNLSNVEGNGAPLLGVKGLVLKNHGDANRDVTYNSLINVSKMIENDFIEKISSEFNEK